MKVERRHNIERNIEESNKLLKLGRMSGKKFLAKSENEETEMTTDN